MTDNTMDRTIVIVEPAYYGRGYIVAARQLGISVIAVVSDECLLDEFDIRGMVDDVVICSNCIQFEILNDLISEMLRLRSIISLIAGNEFLLEVCAKVSTCMSLKTELESSYKASVNKLLARDIYSNKGIPSPRYAFVDTNAKYENLLDAVGFPGVIKPIDSWASQGVQICYSKNDVFNYLSRKRDSRSRFGYRHAEGFLFEELIVGPEYGVELMLVNGEPLAGYVTAKRSSLPPLCDEVGHTVPANLSHEIASKLVTLSARAAAALGFLQGPMNVELKGSNENFVIVELNARPAGDFICTRLLPLIAGIDFYKLHLQLIAGLPMPRLPKVLPQTAAIQFIYPARSGVFRGIAGVEEALAVPGVVEVHQHKTVGDNVQVGTANDCRLAHVITLGVSASEAEEAAYKACNILMPTIDKE